MNTASTSFFVMLILFLAADEATCAAFRDVLGFDLWTILRRVEIVHVQRSRGLGLKISCNTYHHHISLRYAVWFLTATSASSLLLFSLIQTQDMSDNRPAQVSRISGGQVIRFLVIRA